MSLPTRFRSRARRAMFIPCALALAAMVLTLCLACATAGSSSRRTIEVARSSRWLQMASASAFDEAIARITALSGQRNLPLLTSPDEKRDLSSELGWLEGSGISTALTARLFKPEHVEVSDVSFKTGPWMVQRSSGKGKTMVRETGVVELSVTVSVRRPGHRLDRRVSVQRYATAVPMPPHSPEGDGLRIVVSPYDLGHEEVLP